MKMTKEEVLLLTQPAVAGLLSKKEARIAALEDWLREGIAIVVWVGLEGEPYEYRIVYCPGRSLVIHRVIHGEPDDYFEEISTDNLLEIREIIQL